MLSIAISQLEFMHTGCLGVSPFSLDLTLFSRRGAEFLLIISGNKFLVWLEYGLDFGGSDFSLQVVSGILFFYDLINALSLICVCLAASHLIHIVSPLDRQSDQQTVLFVREQESVVF